MDTPAVPRDPLQSDIVATYFFLRFGMAVLAFLFPLILWLGGKAWMGIPIQTAMSAYYHTNMRDVFVGVLFAIGSSLLYYKGFSRTEDWSLNLAGVMAVGIALLPMDPSKVLVCYRPCEQPCLGYSSTLDRTFDPFIASGLHGYCALVFFAAIAIVCGFCSTSTLHLIPDKVVRRTFLWAYRVLGFSMIGIPLAVAAITRGDPASTPCSDLTTFGMEMAGIWVFASFWLLKTIEMQKYGADHTYPIRRAIPAEKARAM